VLIGVAAERSTFSIDHQETIHWAAQRPGANLEKSANLEKISIESFDKICIETEKAENRGRDHGK